MPTQLQTSASLRYCERIKDDSARDYAFSYRAFLMGDKATVPPVPEDVSAMTAQRIRIHLKVLLD